jgi:hypothetical protein
MNAAEYLSFIPMLLYGIALAELFSQWKRFFEKKYLYWPYVVSTVVFTEIAIWNVYLFLSFADEISTVSYFKYWLFLLQPILFLLMVHALTPDPEIKNTEGYFRKRMPVVFGLMALYIGSHLIPGLDKVDTLILPRLAVIALSLGIALSRKVFLVYLLGVLWLISLVLRY